MRSIFYQYYFALKLQNANIELLLWSIGLMGPEAYTLRNAISRYITGAIPEKMRNLTTNA